MGVLDRFLNAMKLNDNDGFDDDDFLDDEMDDFEEEAPKKRFFKKQNEEDDLGDLDMDEKVPSGKEKSKAKSFQKSGSTSSPRPYSTSSAKTSNSGKISQMRTTKKSVAGMEVCVIKPRSMEDTDQRRILPDPFSLCFSLLIRQNIILTPLIIIDFFFFKSL